MKTTSLFLSAILFTACSGVNNSSENKEAKVAEATKKCTPFYVSTAGNGISFVWQILCDGENNSDVRFSYSNIKETPNKLVVDSASSPELNSILMHQIKEGISDSLAEKLFEEIEPLLVKGDEASIAEAHKIYVKALLDEAKSLLK